MKRRVILLVGIVMLLLPAAAALAGGWVAISVDNLPGQIHAGEPVSLSFMVRQHGQTPIHSVEPRLTATNTETGQRIQVEAEPMKELGRFMVTVEFPSEGIWEWSISAEPFPQVFTQAPLTVQVAQGIAAPESNDQPALEGLVALRWIGLALLVTAVALFVVGRWRKREVVAPASGD